MALSRTAALESAIDALVEMGFSGPAARDIAIKAEAEASSRRKAASITERIKATPYQKWLQQASPEYIWDKPIHKVLCSNVDDVIAGRTRRLAIFMPPRLGKSAAITERFPVYFLEANPSARVIIGAYNRDLAKLFTSQSLRIYRSRNPDMVASEAQEEWSTKAGGSVLAAGVGSGVTGRGADCLVGETMVKTTVGNIGIRDLVRLQYKPDVLAYDHASNSLVYRKIVAVREVIAHELVEITTQAGRKIRSTKDHHFWTSESGYKKAELLRPGDRLVAAEGHMSAMRGAQATGESNVSGLLQQDAQANGDDDMLVLRQAVREECLRAREVAAQGARRPLLLQEVLRESSCGQKQAQMRDLRRVDNEEDGRAVLLSEMPGNSARADQAKAEEDLPLVWREVYGQARSADILWSAMRKFSAFGSHAWQGKFSLQGRNELRQTVCRDATNRARSRQSSLRAVRCRRGNCACRVVRPDGTAHEFSHTSCQWIVDRQSAGKSGYSLQGLPQSSSQVEKTDFVADIRIIRGKCIEVYDIQVEGCCNFFAEEILVHNCIIIDDPVRGYEEAVSAAYQNRVWQWWQNDIRTRVNNIHTSPIILINTRWTELDLAGRILEQDKRRGLWKVISFPALAGENDALGRAPGESIWPERLPADELEQIKEEMGVRFDALYQQDPTPAEGGLIQEAWFWKSIIGQRKIISEVRAWDLAATTISRKNSNPDFTAGVRMTLFEGDGKLMYAVRDCARIRAEPGQRDNFIVDVCISDGPECLQIFEENDDGDKTVTHQLRQRLEPFGIGVEGVKPKNDKIVRSTNARSALQRGDMFLVDGRWNYDFVSELVRFPNGRHDDQVDAWSSAYNHLVMRAVRVDIR